MEKPHLHIHTHTPIQLLEYKIIILFNTCCPVLFPLLIVYELLFLIAVRNTKCFNIHKSMLVGEGSQNFRNLYLHTKGVFFCFFVIRLLRNILKFLFFQIVKLTFLSFVVITGLFFLSTWTKWTLWISPSFINDLSILLLFGFRIDN